MKTALVVGSANGIGKAVAIQFLQDGYTVVGVDRESPTIFEDRYEHLLCDLSQPKEVTSLGERLAPYKVNYVVYSAAEQYIFPSLEPNLELLHHMFTVNVASAWQLISQLQRERLSDNSQLDSIVLVSSVHAMATSASIAGYAMTKAALASLVRSLAIDFAGNKTRVNGIAPGAVRTRLLTDHLTEHNIQDYAQKQLIKHVAEPKEIASVIAFLVSEQASYITGQTIVADGGILPVLATEADSLKDI